MGHNEGLAQPAAHAAGHLLALLDERDTDALVRAVSHLARTQPRISRQDNADYRRVLAWVITTIAEVIIEPLQWSSTGDTDFQITFRTFDGHAVDFVAQAPLAVQCVVRAVAAELADDDATVRTVLDYADHAHSAVRADILLEALALLDRVLDARLHHAAEDG